MENRSANTSFDKENLILILSFAKTFFRNNPYYTLIWQFMRYARLSLDELMRKQTQIQCVPDQVFEKLAKKCYKKLTKYVDYKCCVLGKLEGMEGGADCVWYNVCSKKSYIKYKLLVVSYEDCENKNIILSETTRCNLENALHHKLKDASYFFMPADKEIVPFADEASISMISNPYNCPSDSIDCLLDTYFKLPRYLKAKDLFDVDLKTYAPDYFYSSTNPSLRRIYFRVNRLRIEHENNIESTSTGCYIVKGKTTLMQTTRNIHAYLPCKFLEPVGVQDGLLIHTHIEINSLPNYPPSLEKPLQKLEACLSPFMQNDIQMKIKPVFLLKGAPGSGKFLLVKSLAQRNGFNLFNVDIADVQSLSAAQTEAKLRIYMENAINSVPCILRLSNIQIFGKNSEGQKDERIINAFAAELKKLNNKKSKYPLIVIATSEDDELFADMERLFIETICIEHPDQVQRAGALSWFLKSKGLVHQADLNKIAGLCSDFNLADLEALVMQATKIGYQSQRAREHAISLTLQQTDFVEACEHMQATFSERVGAPRIPKVYWEDIGGLANLKHEIKRRIELPMLNSMGLGRSGLLLYGPPGTGKTLLAKAVATECQLHFMSVKGPELLNMYVGQSEKNIRQVFERARAAAPCVIFFDELDSLAPNRGLSGDSGGVMDRVVSQLLAEMDGLESSGNVFIIGATNRPDLIDPALLRPGRFDKMLYVGIYADRESQLSVLRAVTRRFEMKGNGKELEQLVDELPSNLTGADLYAVCSDAWLIAVRRKLEIIEKINDDESKENLLKKTYKEGIVLELQDFIDAARSLVPSVSSEELGRFEKLQKEWTSK